MGQFVNGKRLVLSTLAIGILCLSRLALGQSLGDGAGTPVAQGKPWHVELVALPSAPVHLSFDGSPALEELKIATGDGAEFKLEPCDAAYCAMPYGTAAKSGLPEGAMPDSFVADAPAGSTGPIASLWLADPVQRLGEGPLGPNSAATLVVRDQLNRLQRLELPLDQGFVDLAPRLVDLDGDKAPEIVVVKGQVGVGVSLVVIKLESDGFHIAAESAPSGGAGAWMKLAGIADFNGDGQPDLAAVINPGADGHLIFYTYVRGYLQPLMIATDISNHAPGLAVADMSVAGDFDGDKTVDLAIPSADRMRLRLLSFRNGQVVETRAVMLPSPIVTEILAVPFDSGVPALAAGLADNSLALIGRPQ
jgi:FG-GAP-like repeat